MCPHYPPDHTVDTRMTEGLSHADADADANENANADARAAAEATHPNLRQRLKMRFADIKRHWGPLLAAKEGWDDEYNFSSGRYAGESVAVARGGVGRIA
ncbi:hypothetical protein BJX70DRAFT_313504 [Aspergillus crustosus]